jgi:ABC-type dipeptide/oligopeptide/nickel transport system permease component
MRFVWRLLSVPLILVALIFGISLLVELGREGDVGLLPSSIPLAADFTVDYLGGLARGDLGRMMSPHRSVEGEPVVDELGRALPKSLGLLAVAVALAALVGLTLGIGTALRRADHFSRAVLFASVLGISTPSFFAAMLLIWFSVWLYRAAGQRLFPISGFGWDDHLILPALVLAVRPAAVMARLSHNTFSEILDSDYVRTAVAKGLTGRVVLVRHVLRNAGVPLLTTLGVSLRYSLAVLPIVEYIFSWPGVGQVLLTAIHTQDTTTVIGMTLPLVLLFVLVNVFLEYLYPRVDPRLRNLEASAV